MRVPGLVLMLSAVALGNAGAGEASLRGQQFAQAKTSNVSCMPIGVTAAGELVFPWQCREIIERERGPVSVDLSAPPKETALSQPPLNQPAAGKAAAVSDGPQGQPAAQGAEPQHVATIPAPIPAMVALPPPASPAAEPLMDRRAQPKRLAAGRRQFDAKGVVRAPVQSGAPQPKREVRFTPPG
jgi:hypothetical protein